MEETDEYSELVVGFRFRCGGVVVRDSGFAELEAKMYNTETGELLSGFCECSNMSGFRWDEGEHDKDLMRRVSMSCMSCEEVVEKFVSWVRDEKTKNSNKKSYVICENMARDMGILAMFSPVELGMFLGEPTLFFETNTYYFGMYSGSMNIEASYRTVNRKSPKIAAREALEMSCDDVKEREDALHRGREVCGMVDAMVLRWLVFQQTLSSTPLMIED